MKGKLLFLVALVFMLLLVGFGSFKSGILLLAIPLILYLLAAYAYKPEALRFKVERNLSSNRVTEATPVEVQLRVENAGNGLAEMRIRDLIPTGLEVIQGEIQRVTMLAPDEVLTLDYTVKPSRGRHTFKWFSAYATDPFGLFEHHMRVEAPGFLLSRPRLLKLRTLKIRPPQTRGFAGPISSRQGGTGIDFYGVREYSPGDPLRWVNWKVSARHFQELFTTIYEQEKIANVGIILDAREGSDVQSRSGALFEHSVRASAALAAAFLKDGNRVGLLTYGWGIDGVFPGYGKIQKERILNLLAHARTGFNFALETLTNLPARFFPARSQIIFISPLMREDVQVLIQLRQHGYEVLVISPDPLDYEAKAAMTQDTEAQGADPLRIAYAVRIARLERELLFLRLRRGGVQVVNWQVEMPFERIIETTLLYPPVQRRGLAGGVTG